MEQPIESSGVVHQNKIPHGETAARKLTRREFIKTSAAVTAAAVLSRFIPPEPAAAKPSDQEEFDEKKLFIPKIIHDVEVYGVNTQITTQDQISKLVDYWEGKYYQNLKKLKQDEKPPGMVDQIINSSIYNRSGWEGLRKRAEAQYFRKAERNLEIVVKQSAYKKFLERKNSNGVDFVEWIKMHVDLLNRDLENSKPPTTTRANLLRIVVVGDNFDLNPFREKPIRNEVDGDWFIEEDYRQLDAEKPGSYFCRYYHDKEGHLVLQNSLNYKDTKTFIFPPKEDSLTDKSGWIDHGLIHEWMHRLLYLPDEYRFDMADIPDSFRFRKFYFDTGSFVEPNLSPYLSYLLKKIEEERSKVEFNNNYYDIRPKRINFSFKEGNNNLSAHIEVYKNITRWKKLGNGYTGGFGMTTFPETPIQKIDSGTTIEFADDSFRSEEDTVVDHPDEKTEMKSPPTNWMLHLSYEEKVKELNIPLPIFQMSSIAGISEANYSIEFTGYDDPDKKVHILQLVDESDMESYLAKHQENDRPYALMKIDGTSTYCVWLLRGG